MIKADREPRRDECAYPMKKAGGRPVVYCGRLTSPGKPYCDQHLKLIMVTNSRTTLVKKPASTKA